MRKTAKGELAYAHRLGLATRAQALQAQLGQCVMSTRTLVRLPLLNLQAAVNLLEDTLDTVPEALRRAPGGGV